MLTAIDTYSLDREDKDTDLYLIFLNLYQQYDSITCQIIEEETSERERIDFDISVSMISLLLDSPPDADESDTIKYGEVTTKTVYYSNGKNDNNVSEILFPDLSGYVKEDIYSGITRCSCGEYCDYDAYTVRTDESEDYWYTVQPLHEPEFIPSRIRFNDIPSYHQYEVEEEFHCENRVHWMGIQKDAWIHQMISSDLRKKYTRDTTQPNNWTHHNEKICWLDDLYLEIRDFHTNIYQEQESERNQIMEDCEEEFAKKLITDKTNGHQSVFNDPGKR